MSEKYSLQRSLANNSVEKADAQDRAKRPILIQNANEVSEEELILLKQKLAYSENSVRKLQDQLLAKERDSMMMSSPNSLEQRRNSLRKKVNDAAGISSNDQTTSSFSPNKQFYTREDMEQSRKDVEKEYASLWLAVGELNKLDAEKEQAITDLLRHKEQALLERDTALVQVEHLTKSCQELQEDISEIDKDLYDAIKVNSVDLMVFKSAA